MSLCVLFPGQGAPVEGAFAEWDHAPAGLAAALRDALGAAPASLPTEDLRRNALAQPAIVAIQMAACAAVAAVLPDDACALGYSVGELSAAAFAGCFAPEAAIALAARRAALMDAAAGTGSGLLAIRGLPLARIERLVAAHGAAIAIENGPDHAVAGGPANALDGLTAAAQAAGARTVRRLPVTISSHTHHLAAAAPAFRKTLDDVVAHAPSRTLVSGVAACPLVGRGEVVDSLAVQVHTRLRFADALRAARECGARAFLEIGPGDGLTAIVGDLMPDVPARPLQLFRSPAGVAKWIDRNCR